MMRYTKIFLVQQKLSDYVRKIRNEKGLSRDEVSVKSGYKKNSGDGISPSYIGKIENDATVNPTYPYLKALAKGLEVSEQKLIDIARGSSGETPIYKQLAELFEKIPKNRQEDLLKFAQIFAEENDGVGVIAVDIQTRLEGLDQKEILPTAKFRKEGFSQSDIEFEDSKSSIRKKIG